MAAAVAGHVSQCPVLSSQVFTTTNGHVYTELKRMFRLNGIHKSETAWLRVIHILNVYQKSKRLYQLEALFANVLADKGHHQTFLSLYCIYVKHTVY
jgi:hypothetical protein